MSVYYGRRPPFLFFFGGKADEIRGLNYRRIMLLLRFLAVEIHKKIS